LWHKGEVGKGKKNEETGRKTVLGGGRRQTKGGVRFGRGI